MKNTSEIKDKSVKESDEFLRILIERRKGQGLKSIIKTTISSKYLPGLKERVFEDGRIDLLFDFFLNNYRAERRACISAGFDVSEYDNQVAKITKKLDKVNISPRFTYL